MRFLTRLATGDIALWVTFWLIGLPLTLLWDASGGCMVIGCGIGYPWIGASIIVLFTLSSIAIVLASVAIWRSSSNYPRDAWWKSAIAWGAKACAGFSGLAALLSLIAGFYLIYIFIEAAIAEG
jgi:hypothetical protein